jgi:hypothetical protein
MCVLAFASKTMQEEFKDPQAEGQAIQWPKEKGQSLIYKTFSPTAIYFFTGNKNNFFIFWTKKKNQ